MENLTEQATPIQEDVASNAGLIAANTAADASQSAEIAQMVLAVTNINTQISGYIDRITAIQTALGNLDATSIKNQLNELESRAAGYAARFVKVWACIDDIKNNKIPALQASDSGIMQSVQLLTADTSASSLKSAFEAIT